MEITPRRKVILDALADGSKSWTQLRLAYYGPERAALKANTSFGNQLSAMVAGGLVVRIINPATGDKSYCLPMT